MKFNVFNDLQLLSMFLFHYFVQKPTSLLLLGVEAVLLLEVHLEAAEDLFVTAYHVAVLAQLLHVDVLLVGGQDGGVLELGVATLQLLLRLGLRFCLPRFLALRRPLCFHCIRDDGIRFSRS